MQPSQNTNFLKEEKPQTKQGRFSGFLFTIFVAGTTVLILVFLAQPGVQTSLVQWLGLDDQVEEIAPEAVDYSQLEKVKVGRVVDGDTAVLEDSRRIRYLNIDTPESVKPQTPVQCYAKEASDVNKGLVEGEEVWLKFDKQEEDRYGRLLVFVFLPGKNPNDITQSVNAYLVTMGFARTYIIKPNDTYAEEFAALELEAKSKDLGVWGSCPKPFEE